MDAARPGFLFASLRRGLRTFPRASNRLDAIGLAVAASLHLPLPLQPQPQSPSLGVSCLASVVDAAGSATGLRRTPSRTRSRLVAASLPLLDMALRRASAAARLELPAALAELRTEDCGVGTGAVTGALPVFCGAGAELRIMESARVRPGPDAIPAALPAPDKALRLASASARPLIACPPVC
jgi:hypothetical protein